MAERQIKDVVLLQVQGSKCAQQFMDIISFYENDRRECRNEDNSNMSMYDKKKLKLDLTSKVKKQDNSNAILTSPDLKLLKLDSPELERIILATAGSATPTPKQYRRGKGTSDLSVKEQQEHYVRGFEDALNKMRQQAALSSANEAMITSNFGSVISNNNNIITAKTANDHEMVLNGGLYSGNTITPTANNAQFPTIPTINYGTISAHPISTPDLSFESLRNDTNSNKVAETTKSCTNMISSTVSHVTTDDITAAELLVEPVAAITNTMRVSEQNIGSSIETCNSSTLSTVPIDLQKQELVKTERKKHRNRVAASKCRKRKLERESNLQETVDELKTRNVELGEIAAKLRQQVCDLKLQVMDHVKSGCEVLLTQSLQ